MVRESLIMVWGWGEVEEGREDPRSAFNGQRKTMEMKIYGKKKSF